MRVPGFRPSHCQQRYCRLQDRAYRRLPAVGRSQRIRIEPQIIICGGTDSVQRVRRGAVGVLVCVELDEYAILRLFARLVRHQLVDDGAPIIAHGSLVLVEYALQFGRIVGFRQCNGK